MSEETPISRLVHFFREMKRRKVFRVMTVYAGCGFITLQVCDLLIPALNLPNWTLSLVFVLLTIGFIITVISAWAFEVTPEGVVRVSNSDKEERPDMPHGGKPFTGNLVIVFLLVIIIGLLIYPKFFSTGNHDTIANTASTDSLGTSSLFDPRLGSASIAVLPFTYLANEDSADYFSLGMTDELLSRLAKIENLSVIGRTSVMQYQDTDKTLHEIGKELGVAHLLEGSVQVVGSRVRIQAQLIDSRNETHLWADSYTYPFKDILDLQSRIARQVVRELEAEILPSEVNRLVKSHEIDSKAYRLYLQGRYLRFQETENSLRRSIELLRESISRDINFAPAHAVLSSSALNLSVLTGSDSFIQLSKESAEQAMNLDSSRAEVHIAAGLYQGYINKNFKKGIRHFRRAVHLNPGLSNAHREYGLFLSRLGLFEQALPYLEKAIDLDPVSAVAWGNLGELYLFRKMYDKAKMALQRSRDFNLDNKYVLMKLMLIDIRKGDIDRALDLLNTINAENLTKVWQYNIVDYYMMAGKEDKALRLIQEFELKNDRSIIAGYHWARLHITMGNYQKAINILETYLFDNKNTFWFAFNVESFFDPLRNEPEFRQLIQQIGLDEASLEVYEKMANNSTI